MNHIESYLKTLKEGIPLAGHPYHSKTDAELHYIIKDAGEAAVAMKDHSPKSEAKYLDQVNDASTVLHHRKKSTPKSEGTDRSEFTANLQMTEPAGDHHVYVKTMGRKKSISGPHKTVGDAEAHPSRKFGDGVALAKDLT